MTAGVSTAMGCRYGPAVKSAPVSVLYPCGPGGYPLENWADFKNTESP